MSKLSANPLVATRFDIFDKICTVRSPFSNSTFHLQYHFRGSPPASRRHSAAHADRLESSGLAADLTDLVACQLQASASLLLLLAFGANHFSGKTARALALDRKT